MRNITERKLGIVLKNHALWVGSDGSEGERANLTGVDLTCANLTDANLVCAIRDEVGK